MIRQDSDAHQTINHQQEASMSELSPGRTLVSFGSPLSAQTFTCTNPKQVACNITGGKFTIAWTFSDNSVKTETYSLESNQPKGNGFNGVIRLDITPSQESSGSLERGI
jgi:hypothetical protein